jgi:hypothetical protein
MMRDMGKEIVSGVVFLAGVVLVVSTAETIPVLAGLGAAASLGAGIYQAATSAHRTKVARETDAHISVRRAG